MLRSIQYFLIVCSIVALCAETGLSGPPGKRGRSYPLVYGATGRPYGPTQSHYQYERRYGRPWHGGGSGRVYSASGRAVSYPGYSFYVGNPYYAPAYYGWGAPGFGVSWGGYNGFFYPQFAPWGYLSYQAYPDAMPPSVAEFGQSGTIVDDAVANANANPNVNAPLFQPIPQLDPIDQVLNANNLNDDEPKRHVAAKPFTAIELERSRRFEARGDQKFALTNYLGASENYENAMREAPGLASPRYRNAITLAARSRFDEAVEELKAAVSIDSTWLFSPVTLDEMFGPRNEGEKQRVKTRVAEWASRDVRDPNRLFLLGSLLYLDGDSRSKNLIESAIRFSGSQEHLVAFLLPQLDQVEQLPNPTPTAVVADQDAIPQNDPESAPLTEPDSEALSFPTEENSSIIPPLPGDVDPVETSSPEPTLGDSKDGPLLLPAP
ncbi:hypothetical protein KOR42_07200 [Thalassoglobus neptunius]|uniref:Uncharacterized protein n=1 Tax=Thalassoglobus neptunius TaxID=1938619 RepID=A0A5C5X3D5_9PLAN|nr:hypothetical protein [Thalassoglobus neptunius]TWT57360.1 hypothetical protein KOR42_07200 [Thalassoglobus neptunius]